MEHLTATVEAHRPNQVWRFRKADTLWTILKTDKGICKGIIQFEPKAGDLLRMEGTWTVSTYNGEKEFNFKAVTMEVITDPRALLHYAVSITKGLGPAAESDIYFTFGDDWKNHPELEQIGGMNDKIRFQWQETLKRLENQESMAQAIAFLIEHGCSLNLAQIAWNRWLDEVIPIVQRDCYTLASLPNYGFCHIDDSIRDAFGITDRDPRRLDACVLYHMKLCMEKGDTLVLWDDVQEAVAGYIPGAKQVFPVSVKRLVDEEKLIRIDGALGMELFLALPGLYRDEMQIWEWVKTIGDSGNARP